MTPWQLKTNGPGIHSIPAIHTTHKHIVSLYWPEDQTLREAWLYAIGQTKPNYPVPAIPIFVYIGYDEVFTAEQHDDGIRGDWGFQTPRRYYRR